MKEHPSADTGVPEFAGSASGLKRRGFEFARDTGRSRTSTRPDVTRNAGDMCAPQEQSPPNHE